MSPSEFQERWEQIEPDVRLIMQQVRAETPLRANRSSHDGMSDRAARHIRLSRARVEVAQLLTTHCDMQVFDRIPDWLRYEDTDDGLVEFWRRAARYKSCTDENLTAGVMTQDWKVVRIDAPAWFKNPQFVEWLNTTGTATWHVRGNEPGDYSDVFFTFCSGEGSDWPASADRPGIPDEIWKHLEFVVAEQHGWDAEVLVWVSNLG